MPLRFINKNILQVPADIIVSPSDGMNFTESNISKAIYNAGGNEYVTAISTLTPIKIGNVSFTTAGQMNYKCVAHVAVPDWFGGTKNEREYLDSCYSEVLYSAEDKNYRTVVFPLLGIGLYGFPCNDALNVAVRAIESYLTVKDSLNVFIATTDADVFAYMKDQFPRYCLAFDDLANFNETTELDYKLAHLDYKFMDSLSYYMKRMGYSAVQCYTAAGIDKKLFSKIKNNCNYLPSKSTILKFAFALNLGEKDAQQLLSTCGYILSDSIAEDVIAKYYLSHGIFDYEVFINETLKRSL